MTSLIPRQGDRIAPRSVFTQMDRFFDDWMRAFHQTPMVFGPGRLTDDLIRVDEYRDGDTVVVRAEIPGIDPAKDVDLTVVDGVLRIKAERRMEERTQDKDVVRNELRYGSFTRSLPLPEGAAEDDVAATYKDGILEIRVPVPSAPAAAEPRQIAITTE